MNVHSTAQQPMLVTDSVNSHTIPGSATSRLISEANLKTNQLSLKPTRGTFGF
jgi:hypothetical protein